MKNNNLIALQRKHFNTKEKRYDIDKMLYPPVHTILETNEIIKLLVKKKWTKKIRRKRKVKKDEKKGDKLREEKREETPAK